MTRFAQSAFQLISRARRALARRPVWNVLILAVVFNVFCAGLVWDERQTDLQQAQASADNLTAAIGRDISRNIEIIDLSIHKMIKRVQGPGFAQRDAELRRELLIDQVATARYFAALAVTDASGKVLYHSRTPDPSFIKVAGNDFFRVHRDRPDAGLYVSLPIRSPFGYGLGIVFSRRMSAPDGSFAGIAYVALDADYFMDLFRRMNLGRNGTMVLLRTDKKLMLRMPFSEAEIGVDMSKAGIFEHFPQKRSGSVISESPLDGVSRLITFAQVGDFPLTITVGRTLDDVYGDWRRRALMIGAILVILTGAMVGLAINLRRELRRRQETHQEALRNEALFRGAMKGAGIGTIMLGLDGTVMMINPAFTRLFGYREDEAARLTVADGVHPGDALPENARLLSGEIDFDESERRYVCKNGEVRWVLRSASLVRNEAGGPAYLIVQFQDITARREAEEQLRYAATHDELTRLLNRAAFEEEIAKALEESRRTGIKHTLAFLDLDRLKIINDSEGHAAGDAMLQWVAKALPAYMRDGDVIGRLGGDEFGVILFGCSLDDATEVLERLNSATGAIQFPWGDRSYSVGASIGLAEISTDSDSPSTLLAQADVACMAAKMAGRNRISIYRPEQSDAVERHRELSMAAGIRQAVQDERLCLYAQRILGCGEDVRPRYEILLRMNAKDGSTVPPGLFIPAAERYDLIGEIDRWVVRHALKEVRKAVAADPDLRVHINLSAASIGDPLFLDDVLEAIEMAGVRPQALVFEITETALISKMTVAEAMVRKLREIGCQIALDDFGSGLSSFQYLRKFPVDIVKIDGSFVRSMVENGVDRNIVKSIHQIARELGAQTVAEDIEDGETLTMISAMGIDFAQGYAIHRPAPIEDVLANLTSDPDEESLAATA